MCLKPVTLVIHLVPVVSSEKISIEPSYVSDSHMFPRVNFHLSLIKFIPKNDIIFILYNTGYTESPCVLIYIFTAQVIVLYCKGLNHTIAQETDKKSIFQYYLKSFKLPKILTIYIK